MLKKNTPKTRALRNSTLMTMLIGGLLYYEGHSWVDIALTMTASFAILFPALWLAYNYTYQLMLKHFKESYQMPAIQIGQTAPDFSQPNQHNKTVSLSDYAGKNLVLYFYPKDDTPGCTIEANDFTALLPEFAQANTVVVGVSKDSCSSHLNFIEKFDLGIDLLADTDGLLCDAYNVWREKEKNGEKTMGIVRSTFIINADGKIVFAEYGVNPAEHAQTVLNFVKAL